MPLSKAHLSYAEYNTASMLYNHSTHAHARTHAHTDAHTDARTHNSCHGICHTHRFVFADGSLATSWRIKSEKRREKEKKEHAPSVDKYDNYVLVQTVKCTFQTSPGSKIYSKNTIPRQVCQSKERNGSTCT